MLAQRGSSHRGVFVVLEPILPWNDTFKVGHPGLDREHYLIVDLINTLGASDEGDRGAQSADIHGIRDAISNHLDHEDRVLRLIAAQTSSERSALAFVGAMSQALISEHIAQHARSRGQLDALFGAAGKPATAAEKALKLTEWFVTHAVKYDAHLKTLFQTIDMDCPQLLETLG